MKKILLTLFLTISSVNVFAQIEVIELKEHADTLITSISTGMDYLDIYRSEKGYLIKTESTNSYDHTQNFYLGKTAEDVTYTLRWLSSMCDKDIATQAIIKDAAGGLFTIRTVYGVNATRQRRFIQGDRITINNDSMAGIFIIRKKSIEEIIKYFEKLI